MDKQNPQMHPLILSKHSVTLYGQQGVVLPPYLHAAGIETKPAPMITFT
jgi:hypothetical protein